MPMIQNLVYWASASDPTTLNTCSIATRKKRAGIGRAVLVTGLLATIGGTLTLSGKGIALHFAVLGGIAWGAVIVSLDVLILSTLHQGKGVVRQGCNVLVRLVIALIMSAVINEPINLWLERERIDAKLHDIKIERENHERRDARMRYGVLALETKVAETERKLEEAKNNLDALPVAVENLRISAETCMKRYTQEQSRQLRRLEHLHSRQQRGIGNANALQERINAVRNAGFLARFDDVQRLTLLQQDISNTSVEMNAISLAMAQVDTQCGAARKDFEAARQAHVADASAKRDEIANQLLAGKSKLEEASQSAAVAITEAVAIDRRAFGTNRTAQVQALGALRREDEAINQQYWLWFSVLLALDLAPLIVKVLGGADEYDRVMRSKAAEIKGEANLSLKMTKAKNRELGDDAHLNSLAQLDAMLELSERHTDVVIGAAMYQMEQLVELQQVVRDLKKTHPTLSAKLDDIFKTAVDALVKGRVTEPSSAG